VRTPTHDRCVQDQRAKQDGMERSHDSFLFPSQLHLINHCRYRSRDLGMYRGPAVRS
jgi:hypothetical protein